jgi:hypothetical protein
MKVLSSVTHTRAGMGGTRCHLQTPVHRQVPMDRSRASAAKRCIKSTTRFIFFLALFVRRPGLVCSQHNTEQLHRVVKYIVFNDDAWPTALRCGYDFCSTMHVGLSRRISRIKTLLITPDTAATKRRPKRRQNCPRTCIPVPWP